MRRRVVVTGMGMITPVGKDVESSWEALREGRGGVGPITLFDAGTFPTRIAAEVSGFDLGAYRADSARWTEHSRTSQFALAAATQAVAHAGLDVSKLDSSRFGVYLGSGEGQQDFGRFVELVHGANQGGKVDTAAFTRMGLHRLHPTREDDQEPGKAAGHLASVFGARGANMTCQTACAASAQAIGGAVDLIRRGELDVVLGGGAHSMIHPLGVTGFILLTAMSTRNDAPARASRPFDRDRDGFVLGEGAGVLVLEDYEHARARGARIHAEIVGFGMSSDASHITLPPDDGNGARRAMQNAMRDAGLNPEQISYVNAHGTSTPAGDLAETVAMKGALGDHAKKVAVSSTKSMTGHLLGAAGGIEAVFSILAIRDNLLPPTINLDHPSEGCDLDYVPHQARESRVDVVLSNSFGFGGTNGTLAFARFK